MCLLEIPSSVIHKDSSEAQSQIEREKALELSLQRRVVQEEVEEIKVEEIEKKKVWMSNVNLRCNFVFYIQAKKK